MDVARILVLCNFAVGLAQCEVTLKADRPFLSVPLSHTADLKCCYDATAKPVYSSWVKSFRGADQLVYTHSVNLSGAVTAGVTTEPGAQCGTLTLVSAQLNDSGLYQCRLNTSRMGLVSHGTYLQVYKPLDKTFNLSESTKNKILTAEGILLLLCMLLPSATLFCKSKKLHELEKKKMKAEEENIYQGLNLDDCAIYDQIERSQVQSQYQDVCNIVDGENEIQLEKP